MHLADLACSEQVAGNFHFAPGKSFQQGNMHVHDLVPFPTKKFDMSHHINKLSFGKVRVVLPSGVSSPPACPHMPFDSHPLYTAIVKRMSLSLQEYPGRKNPLDGVKKSQLSPDNPDGGTGMFQYFLKVCHNDSGSHMLSNQATTEYPQLDLASTMRMQAVPTTYVDVRNNTTPTYQYSVTEYFKVSAPAVLQLAPAARQVVEGGMGPHPYEVQDGLRVLCCSTLIWLPDRTSQVSKDIAGQSCTVCTESIHQMHVDRECCYVPQVLCEQLIYRCRSVLLHRAQSSAGVWSCRFTSCSAVLALTVLAWLQAQSHVLLQVRLTERRSSIAEFLTSACAIVG